MKINNKNVWGTAKVGDGTKLGAFVDIGGNVGKNCNIQTFASIPPGVTIEDDVFVGPGVTFTNDFTPRAYEPRKKEDLQKTIVKKGASIGANATILCGITIGEYSGIGAGSVVTKDVQPNSLVYGNPARFIDKIGKNNQWL